MSPSTTIRRARAALQVSEHERPSRAARTALVWRCGWCSRDRAGARRAPAALETTGICEPCLGAQRAIGSTHQGPGFLVWDEDPREAARWADELRAAAGSRRRPAAIASVLVP